MAFVKLVRRLDVSFAYRFDSRLRNDVQGGIALDARVADGTGWSRVVPIAQTKPFDGPVARAEGVLDLARLESLGARMRDLTGSGTSSFVVTLVPRVDVMGYAGTSLLDESFAPELRFGLDSVSLKLDAAAGEGTSLLPRVEGVTRVLASGRLELGPVSLPVSDARVFAVVGIAATVLILLGAVVVLRRAGGRSEGDRITARYGSRIVRASTSVPDGRSVTDVTDIAALVRLAQHYDRVILQTGDERSRTYLLDDGVTLYRFQPPTLGSPPHTPAVPARS